jgi:tRNA(Ile)-lysidine synthase
MNGESFMVVRTPGTYHMCGLRMTVEVLPWTSDMPLKQPAGTIILDASMLTFPFVLRGWRNGDWMIPLGMKGKKKLSDLFTDLKYGYVEKSSAIAIVDCKGDSAQKQHVAGVVPVRIDEHYKVTDSTKEIIRITLTDNR